MTISSIVTKPAEDLETRAQNVLKFMTERDAWMSARNINEYFNYVHSTLWKTLKYLEGEGYIRTARSLADTRITLYRITDKDIEPVIYVERYTLNTIGR
jgi:DNA-binding MarR family transcriptional regulator